MNSRPLKIEYRRVDSLRPDPKDARVHNVSIGGGIHILCFPPIFGTQIQFELAIRKLWSILKGRLNMAPLPGYSRGSRTSLHDHLSGKLVVEYLLVASLLLDPKNPRIHSEKQVQQIARSIETFGFISPVLVDAGLHVIAGHGRLLACKTLGMKSVPAIRVEHLSEKQRLAFMITDNRLTENSNWDHQLLGEQLKILSETELDFTLETTGFETAEIDLIIENLSPAPEGKDDPADAVPETPAGVQLSQAGDLWLLGRHRVYCGSSLNESTYAALMGDAKATMVFSDLPFNVRVNGHATGLGAIQHRDFRMAADEFADFLSRVFSLLASHSIDGSIHFICVDWRHLGELLAAGKVAYSELNNICVWVKDNADMGSLYRSQYEMVLAFKHGKEPHLNNIQLGQYGRYRSNVWNYPGVNSFSRSTDEGNLLAFHSTVKPVALVADAIKDTSARGDLVLDAFLGSGTTIIAAERTGRKCYGIESDPLSVDTIVRRWQKFTRQSAVHGISGRNFAELEEEVGNGLEQRQ